ncbi:YiiD C-terminal domain-containing protein [Algiphilus sp.]|uniref:YiiD C-terminal domain-containing protein n=1 Tax=Algiphilus sp. TaxID=1872431 RepID=UPI003B522BB6
MQLEAATQLLYRQVPLLRHTDVRVTALQRDAVQLSAPLAANGNHHGTAFGGSLSMLGIVAGWLLAYVGQDVDEPTTNIVIADSHTRYLRPLRGDLLIEAHWRADDGKRYRAQLAAGRKADITIQCRAGDADAAAIRQDSRFVAIPL